MSAPAPEARSDAAIQRGMRLRDARQRAKLSLRELARRVDVSASLVSQVELGRTSPSIGTLYALVSELGLSLDAVMQDEDPVENASSTTLLRVVETSAGVVAGELPTPDAPKPATARHEGQAGLPGLLRSKDRPQLHVDGVRWERLTAENDPNVELLRVTYRSGTESCPPDNLMRHGGQEYFHILEGKLTVDIGSSVGILDVGDSINFNSSCPHRLSNPFEEDCVAIWVVVGRRGHEMDNTISPGS